MEFETLEEMDAWGVVGCSYAMNGIDSIWAFKLKQFPDGLIKKFKARLCARVDQQLKGIDIVEKYVPLVQCTNMRMMLILGILLKLKSKQGTITAAFLHADLNKNIKIYGEMSLGFRKKGK